MLSFLIGAFSGIFIGVLLPEAAKVWVRGAVGRARGLVLGAVPARSNLRSQLATSTEETVRPSAQNKPIESAGSALKPSHNGWVSAWNLGAGFARIVGFVLKHPVLCLGLALVAFWLLAGRPLPFGLGASKADLRAQIKHERATNIVLQHERDLSNRATNLAENTLRVEAETREAVKKGQEDIADAVGQDDFDLLYSVYERSYRRVFDNAEREDRSDPGAGRSAPLRRPGADRA